MQTFHMTFLKSGISISWNFHSINKVNNLSYNFGGDSPHSNNIFKIQKRTIRIINKSRYRDSCRELFKKLEILPWYSQCMFDYCLW